MKWDRIPLLKFTCKTFNKTAKFEYFRQARTGLCQFFYEIVSVIKYSLQCLSIFFI